MEDPQDSAALERSQRHVQALLSRKAHSTLPAISVLHGKASELLESLPNHGWGIEETTTHLLDVVAPGLNGSSLSANYYGFVTGGATPAARIADSIVGAYDQNVCVHLPDQTIATIVEDKALRLLLDLLKLDVHTWSGRTFTTGATASNVLGLLLGRESIINQATQRHFSGSGAVEGMKTVAQDGLLDACKAANIDCLHVLATMPHSSLIKAASIVGVGRASVIHVGTSSESLDFDFEILEGYLKRKNTASIVAVSCGEVNTGLFATHGCSNEMRRIRSLCDKYGAWLHVDAGEVSLKTVCVSPGLTSGKAFGGFARILDENPEFDRIRDGVEGLEVADSITGDAHKFLNVPYDCGFFFCRHKDLAHQVLQNPNAAYLDSNSTGPETIMSPLNIGIENSRRFRGLPVYATLMAYGRQGYKDLLMRQIRFARQVARLIQEHPALELLPKHLAQSDASRMEIFIVLLFRARESTLNAELVSRINATARIYVTGTKWRGEPASRIAVSNWQVDPERDLQIVREVFESVLGNRTRESE